jgi:hypothetical protein
MQVKTADIHRNSQTPLILMSIALLLGASAFAKVMAFYAGRGQMQGVAGWNRTESDPNALKDCLGEAKKVAEAIKQKNLFIKEPPKEHPIKQVDGILGSEAFIAGKWYKAGEKVGDATIVEICPTFVKVEWDGKTTNVAPIGAAESGQPSPPPAAKEPKKETSAEAPKAETKAAAAPAETPEAEQEDPLGWLRVRMSPRLRAMLMEKWNGASDEDKARAKEEWGRMSDSEQQRIVDEMEKHL